jgi:pyruvate dehydrogenase E2 component (dihydrolipoamide acetyltransferase)
MPRLSDTMTEGVLARWIMHEGDEVKRGDVLAEIETDKATMDLEAYDDGTLTKILVEEGTTVAIGEPLAVIGEAGEEAGETSGGAAEEKPEEPSEEKAEEKPEEPAEETSEAKAEPPEKKAEPPEKKAEPEEPAEKKAEPKAGQPAPQEEAPPKQRADEDRVRATPLVRSLARERGIDLTTVKGSGPNGRIVRADLDEAAQAPAEASAEKPSKPAEKPAAPAAVAPTPSEGDEKIPLSSIRRITAQRLTESAAAPHFYLTMGVDTAALLDFRAQLNAQFADDEVRISVTDLLVRACAVVLRAHPEVNASWGGDHVLRRASVNVGIAVAINDGLIVPVIRDADRKTVREISAEASDLGERARAGSLKPEEFSGGTFTISNLGMFGISEFTAVINPPEAAILAVGAAAPTPVVTDDGSVSVTTIMRLTLTVDHRVLDGATGAAFLRDLVKVLEEPLRIVT